MSLVTIADIDTWALATSLRVRRKLFTQAGAVHRIMWPIENDPWPAAAGVMRRISRLPGGEDSEFGYAAFELLTPGSVVPWGRSEEGWRRLHLPLVTNSRCFVYCGVAAASLPPGRVTILGAGLWCSEANFGETPRIHLVIDFRQKPAKESSDGRRDRTEEPDAADITGAAVSVSR